MLEHTLSRRPLRVVQPCSSGVQRSDSESSADKKGVQRCWPSGSRGPRRFGGGGQEQRPQTATLARPRVLDACFLTQVDMSLTRKALFNMSNVCKRGHGRTPLKAFAKLTTSAACMQLRPNHRPLGRSKSEADEGWEDEDSSSEALMPRSRNFVTKKGESGAKTTAVAKKGNKRTIPEPCRSCGRSDLPERLHSHPTTRARVVRSQTVPMVTLTRPIKSSVQRPTPIKYKSAANNAKKENLVKKKPEAKGILKSLLFPKPPTSPNLGHKSPQSPTKRGQSPSKLNSKPPASPKPVSPQTKIPVTPKEKPAKVNKSPSPKMGSKLSPKKDLSPTRATSPRSFVVVEDKAAKKPATPLVKGKACYLCGKDFSLVVLPTHEAKCLEKWQKLNSKVPANMQRSVPLKSSSTSAVVAVKEGWNQFAWRPNQSHEEAKLGPRRPLQQPPKEKSPATSPTHHSSPLPQQEVECQLCGRTFATLTLESHQPLCMRRWRQQNDKLPPEQRKPEPRLLTHLSEVLEHEDTFTAIYESHLEKLVPCKSCGRTFLPERLEVHLRSCLTKDVAKR